MLASLESLARPLQKKFEKCKGEREKKVRKLKVKVILRKEKLSFYMVRAEGKKGSLAKEKKKRKGHRAVGLSKRNPERDPLKKISDES